MDGWAQLQDHPTLCERGAIPTAAILFRRVGLLFVKRRGPQQMLCSTCQLDPDALMFQRWQSLRWEICTAHPLPLGRGPTWPQTIPCQGVRSQPPLLLHQNGIGFFFRWEAQILLLPLQSLPPWNMTAYWPQHMHNITLLYIYIYVSDTHTLVFPFWIRRLQREECDEK